MGKAPQLTPEDVVKALCDGDDPEAQVMKATKDNLISIIDHIHRQFFSLNLPPSWKRQNKDALQKLFQEIVVLCREDIKMSQDKKEANNMKITTPSALGTLSTSVQELMSLIFSPRDIKRRMQNCGYVFDKVPLEDISEQRLSEAKEKLKRLAKIPGPKTVMDEVSEDRMTAWNEYNLLIPRWKSDRQPGHCDCRVEVELLEDLHYMKIADDIMKAARTGTNTSADLLNRQFQGLRMKEMTPVDRDSAEFRGIELYFSDTIDSADNHYAVRDVFRIERGEEEACLRKYAKIRNSQRRLLWYGSRNTNFAGILRQGLRNLWPNAPVCESPWEEGIDLHDCKSQWEQGIYLHDSASEAVDSCEKFPHDEDGLLLLCEVKLGRTFVVNDGIPESRRRSYMSTKLTGRCGTIKWKNAECLDSSLKGVLMPEVTGEAAPGARRFHNRWIAYNGVQVRPKYLVRVKSSRPQFLRQLSYCRKIDPLGRLEFGKPTETLARKKPNFCFSAMA